MKRKIEKPNRKSIKLCNDAFRFYKNYGKKGDKKMPTGYDFCGWATKNDLKCGDGRTIRKNAFSSQNGKKVPLVWNHQWNNPENTLGHALLENREDGVYAYCYFNDTPSAAHAKTCVTHGDIMALSIAAGNLDQDGRDVVHGIIKEVSLVHAGSNPGAFIESFFNHTMPMDDDDDQAIIYTGETLIMHADDGKKKEDDEKNDPGDDDKKSDGKTVADVYKSMDEDQKAATAYLVNEAVKEVLQSKKDDEKGENEMKHNIFDSESAQAVSVLTHDDRMAILEEARRAGSLRDVLRHKKETEGLLITHGMNDGIILVHSIDDTGMETAKGNQTYGFNDPEMLFPEFKSVNGNAPEWISRNMDWVNKVMAAVHRTPFSRIKSTYANITEDEARARGYIKGKQKKEEVFTTLKRTTTPQTVYKLQKLDRDDVVDITDFDVIAWIRAEMRLMLNEEIARAVLIGDGRPSDSDDHISEEHIRPIVKDVPLFNVVTKVEVNTGATEEEIAKTTIKQIIKSRKNYKGSGNPTFFTTEDYLTEMLLLEDGIGHRLYRTEAELATALRVREIVTVEPMAGYELDIESKKYPLIGVVVNLADYNIGADKGGEISNFDDFDIDFNQYKYLIETRISGALIKPFSALTYVLDNGISGATLLSTGKNASKVADAEK